MAGKRKKRRKPKLAGLYLLGTVTVLLVAFSYVVSLLNQRFLPTIIAIAEMNAQTRINELLNESLAAITQESGLESADFYVENKDAEGKINAISANTLLINDLCARLATDLSEKLSTENVQTVAIPVGSLLGIDILANTGPDYAIELLPRGNVIVDYETSFLSAGINQTNYQIFLTVNARVQIVNPMQDGDIVVTRKIALVNTVINGDVPPAIHALQ